MASLRKVSKQPAKNRSFTVRAPSALIEQLEQAAAVLGITMSEAVRQALEQVELRDSEGIQTPAKVPEGNTDK